MHLFQFFLQLLIVGIFPLEQGKQTSDKLSAIIREIFRFKCKDDFLLFSIGRLEFDLSLSDVGYLIDFAQKLKDIFDFWMVFCEGLREIFLLEGGRVEVAESLVDEEEFDLFVRDHAASQITTCNVPLEIHVRVLLNQIEMLL